ncbi:unnamed protein product [Caretta caretta]
MAEQRQERREPDLPAYFAALGSGSPKPRQKFGGMFCSVEGAFENKTLDLDALSGGGRGGQTPERGALRQLPGDSQGQSQAGGEALGSRSAPALTPAGAEPPPPAAGAAGDAPDGHAQVTGKRRRPAGGGSGPRSAHVARGTRTFVRKTLSSALPRGASNSAKGGVCGGHSVGPNVNGSVTRGVPAALLAGTSCRLGRPSSKPLPSLVGDVAGNGDPGKGSCLSEAMPGSGGSGVCWAAPFHFPESIAASAEDRVPGAA